MPRFILYTGEKIRKMIYIETDLIEAVDRVRGNVPFSSFVSQAIIFALAHMQMPDDEAEG